MADKFFFLAMLLFFLLDESELTDLKKKFNALETEHLKLQVDCVDSKEAYWRDIDQCKQQGCKL